MRKMTFWLILMAFLALFLVDLRHEVAGRTRIDADIVY